MKKGEGTGEEMDEQEVDRWVGGWVDRVWLVEGQMDGRRKDKYKETCDLKRSSGAGSEHSQPRPLTSRVTELEEKQQKLQSQKPDCKRRLLQLFIPRDVQQHCSGLVLLSRLKQEEIVKASKLHPQAGVQLGSERLPDVQNALGSSPTTAKSPTRMAF